MNSSSLAPHGVLEPLEARLAPAGLVTLTTSGGVLTITGDAEANGVLITHQPTTGEWRIEDNLVGTTYRLNGVDIAGPFNIPEQNSIKADFKEGNDRFEFRPTSAPSGLLLSGGINVKLGEGNDLIELGFLGSYVMVVNGPVVVDAGLGDDTLNVWMTATFANNVKLLGGMGNDTIQLLDFTGYQHYQKGLTIDLGTGLNTLNVNLVKFAVSGPLNIIGAGETGLAQTINMQSAQNQWDGPVNIGIKAGDVTLNLGNANTDTFRLGSTMKITTGLGADVFNFQGQISAAGAISVDAKGGASSLTFSTGGNLFGTSFTYKGGLDADAINHNTHDFRLTGAYTVSLGAGDNLWDTDNMASMALGSLNVTALGGTDFVNFDGTTFSATGSVTANLGAGTNLFGFTGSVSTFIGGSLSYTGGADLDNYGFNTPLARILGSVNLKPGGGNNTGTLDGAELFIGGSLNYLGGTGDDALSSENGLLTIVRTLNYKSGGGANNSLYLRPVNGSIGAVNYTGAAGADILALGEISGASTTRLDVFGNVTHNGGAGGLGLYVADTVVHGKLLALGTSGVADVDLLSLRDATFHGAVGITMGAGSLTSGINDVTMRADFLLNTGGGNDSISIETLAGTAALSRWFGKVTINAGAGADTVTVGLAVPPDAQAGSVFYKGITVNGGVDADVDTLISGGNTFLAGTVLGASNFP